MSEYHWLDEETYAKVEGQTRLQIGAILGVYNLYGMGVYFPQTLEAIMQVVRQYGKRVRGKDAPIVFDTKLLPIELRK